MKGEGFEKGPKKWKGIRLGQGEGGWEVGSSKRKSQRARMIGEQAGDVDGGKPEEIPYRQEGYLPT